MDHIHIYMVHTFTRSSQECTYIQCGLYRYIGCSNCFQNKIFENNIN